MRRLLIVVVAALALTICGAARASLPKPDASAFYVVNAANGLLGLLRQLGRTAPRIQGDEATRLQDAVSSSSFDVWTSKDGHLLRRLLLKADLGLNVPAELRRVLGDVVGAKIDFELEIARANQPVRVTPP